MRYGGNDHYLDENGVLKNKLGAKTADELENIEKDLTAFRIAYLQRYPINAHFDLAHLQAIHKYIFSPIYEWAGEIRDGSLSKGNSVFTFPHRIEPELNKLFNQLKNENYLIGLDKENIIKRLAFYLGEINVHHPFREGNGRVQRLFIAELAQKAGYKLDFSFVSQDEMISASILVLTKMNYTQLEDIISRSITPIN
ncbi:MULTISPECIES: Fic family protein [Glaesserella]|uniref:protein adenylyltransferase n=1 Tax=Glaesserella australis TaxID=2094024 RepID=A0A328C4Z0_9PAST|nr:MULTISPECIES: Fic family protein [Glaesserella]AUI65400.1 cell filamentation protein Fic [Glaesserella sp. 15-184]RAL19594.1 cell filamentation protein Fic [Glaesserella australis]